jgi:putative transposase
VATIMDLYSREIVGWNISSKHDTALVAAAFFDAMDQHARPRILNSDRGSEYLSQIYMELAGNCGVSMSYSAKASPWENGYQESFYSGFKVDLGDAERFTSVGELIEAIHLQLYIYNHYRIHLALRMAPKQYLRKEIALTA